MIFVSAPYTHKDPNVVKERMKQVALHFNYLLNVGKMCLSPLATGQFILDRSSIPSSFDFWKEISLRYIDLCDTVHVLMLEGYDISTGVQCEIEYALSIGKKIVYIENKEVFPIVDQYGNLGRVTDYGIENQAFWVEFPMLFSAYPRYQKWVNLEEFNQNYKPYVDTK